MKTDHVAVIRPQARLQEEDLLLVDVSVVGPALVRLVLLGQGRLGRLLHPNRQDAVDRLPGAKCGKKEGWVGSQW